MMAGEFPQVVRLLIMERSGQICERCACHPASDIHHRCPRKKGGSRLTWMGLASNGVALCRPCHDWAEANRGDEAFDLGWRIRQGEAEQNNGCETTPLVDTIGRIWLLFNDGTKVTC